MQHLHQSPTRSTPINEPSLQSGKMEVTCLSFTSYSFYNDGICLLHILRYFDDSYSLPFPADLVTLSGVSSYSIVCA